MQRPEYDDIQRCLRGPDGGSGAAEAHGTLCGLLCTAANDLPESWIKNTLADAGETATGINDDEYGQLANLHQLTLRLLDGVQMEFQLLLPDDDIQLGLRADALGRWCQGFLYGLAVRGLKTFDQLPEEIREILEDLSEITQANFAEGEGEQEGEDAYANLVEYVRVGVQLVFDELNPPVKDMPGPAQVH
ncbi:MAG: UPF0149 family protein [Gammaproteobacteria bacterium]|mgnify:CR=1 FL=1